MILGLSFGKKKQSSTTSGVVAKDEAITGSQQQSTTGLQQSQSSSVSSGTQSSSQVSDVTNRTNQMQTDRGSQTTRGTTSTLDAATASGLSSAVQRLLAGGINDANIANLSNMIAGVTGFNPETMVAGIVDGARGRGERELQERNAAIQSAVGGTDTTNSMAALLAQQGRNSLERNIAEITAQATGQAEQIRNANLMTGVQAQGGLAEQAAGLGGVLKGAQTTVDQATLTDQLSQLLGTQNQSGVTAGTQVSTQQQETATTQLIQELLSALTSQQTNSIGTENSTTRGKSSGGGLSISL